MRFSNLLTLLAATSAFALNFKRDFQLSQLGQILKAAKDGQVDTDNQDAAEALECIGIITTMMDKCFGVSMTSMENMDDITSKFDEKTCSTINSNECQTLLKDNSGKCGDSLSSMLPAMNLYCITDENGKLCPISVAIQKQAN